MINTSAEYKKAILKNREFHIKDEYVFANGKTETLGNRDFLAYSIDDAIFRDGSISIGTAIAKEYKATLNNSDGRFDGCSFAGCKIQSSVGLKLPDGSIEYVKKGTFTIPNGCAKINELTIQITAYDSMILFDKPYTISTLTYPATLLDIIVDACEVCGVSAEYFKAHASDKGFDTYIAKKRPEKDGLTFRDVISYCAQIILGYATIRYDDELFIHDSPFYAVKTLKPKIDKGEYTGTPLNPRPADFLIDDLTSQSINSEYVGIVGIQLTYRFASYVRTQNLPRNRSFNEDDGYIIKVKDNPFILPNYITLVNEMNSWAETTFFGADAINVRPLSIYCRSDPSMEAGDTVVVRDRKGRYYATLITHTKFTAWGSQLVECNIENAIENAGRLQQEGDTTGSTEANTTESVKSYFGTCSTPGATAAKICDIEDFSLKENVHVTVHFENSNTANTPTLNISNTGAKPIYYKNAHVPVGYIKDYADLELVYSGNCWTIVGDLAEKRLDDLENQLHYLVSPISLYSGNKCNTALGTYEYVSVPNMNNYKEIGFWARVGDRYWNFIRVNRSAMDKELIFSGYANANYNAVLKVKVDFSNNRIGVNTPTLVGWPYSVIYVSDVVGLAK